MRQETITIYKFNDLPSESAKERARERGRKWLADDPAWVQESLQSIKAFCEHFGVTLRDWSVNAYEPFYYSTDAKNHNFRNVKLRGIDRAAMPTGYCLDCALWETMYDKFKRTGNALAAFEAALDAGFKAWCEDLESQLEDEYIEGFLMLNEYEFDENGELA